MERSLERSQGYTSDPYLRKHHPINNPVDFKITHDNKYIIQELQTGLARRGSQSLLSWVLNIMYQNIIIIHGLPSLAKPAQWKISMSSSIAELNFYEMNLRNLSILLTMKLISYVAVFYKYYKIIGLSSYILIFYCPIFC